MSVHCIRRGLEKGLEAISHKTKLTLKNSHNYVNCNKHDDKIYCKIYIIYPVTCEPSFDYMRAYHEDRLYWKED